MLFSAITTLCYALEQQSSRLEKKKILHAFILLNHIDDVVLVLDFLTLSINDTVPLFNIDHIILTKYISEYFNIELEKVIDNIKKEGDIGSFFRAMQTQLMPVQHGKNDIPVS